MLKGISEPCWFGIITPFWCCFGEFGAGVRFGGVGGSGLLESPVLRPAEMEICADFRFRQVHLPRSS